MAQDFATTAFRALSPSSPEGVQDELDPQARVGEARSFLIHAASLSMTKMADGLIDPKLVLAWLMNALGAPAFLIGLLVPIREAGALLPQLFVAPLVQRMRLRKWVWVVGSAVQGAMAAGILVVALTLGGMAAGIAICLLLAVLAVARSLCSVSYKDVLGKTVGMSRRGSATGLGTSASAVGVIVFALVLMGGLAERMTLVMAGLGLAGALWAAAAALFATLGETPSSRVAKAQGHGGAGLSQMALLRRDPQLLRFVGVRGLLVATALAPPYLVLLSAQDEGGTLGRLGAMVLASALASLVSSYLWGRMADRSSRLVLIRSGLMGAAALGLALLLHRAGVFGRPWAPPLVLFMLMIAYFGVRQGRSTYLVDMAPADQRATYTAVANTTIGLLLLASGAISAASSLAGVPLTLVLFLAMSVASAALGLGLKEVEGRKTG
ncbi:MFS transporter [Brevirhabdus sp.]|uniref:MFS transporter n=1 Tax=Brevirhabdus sp. TaxID=2004514 RepID=UPI004059F88A